MLTEINNIPIELLEQVAENLSLTSLKNFRSTNRRAASAGYKPLLSFVPTAIICSSLKSPHGVSARPLRDVLALDPSSPIAKAITALTIGRGATDLHLLASIRLPGLTNFQLHRIEVESAHDIALFLFNHANTLRSLEICEVDVLAEGKAGETLPSEWRAILTTIKSLPHISELTILDIGYCLQIPDLRFKIWFHQESIAENERLRSEAQGQCEVLIRAKVAQATAHWAVDAVIDAVLMSTGRKVFKFLIS